MVTDLSIGEIFAALGVITAQAVGLWKLIDGRFRRVEEAMHTQAHEMRSEMGEHTSEEMERYGAIRAEVGRVDKDVASLRARVDTLPTHQEMSALLDVKMDRLETKLDRALARVAVSRAHGPDDGN